MAGKLTTALLMQATGGCPGQIDEIIRGWEQYKDRVELLPRPEQDKISQISELIVSSFTRPGCVPLGQIMIVGHADKDAHGVDFEKKVSNERATSVAAALSAAVIAGFKKHGVGHLAPGAIAFMPSPTGVGAVQPDAANLPTVKDRTLNRRVVIQVRQRGAPVPLPDTLERRVKRALKILETKGLKGDPGQRKPRAVCLLNKMLKTDVVDLFVDGLQTNKRIGTQDVRGPTAGFDGRYDGAPVPPGPLGLLSGAKPSPPLPDSEFVKLLGTVSSELKGSNWAPGLRDDDILEFLDVVVLEKIYRGILYVERYLATQVHFSGQYIGDKARIRCHSLYSDHFDDDNNIYNCWKGYTGGEGAHIL
jgi:hypothetical protein